jgi:hypothetical protein
MSMRKMAWGALVMGMSFVSVACGPSMEAQVDEQSPATLEQGAGAGSFCGGFAGIACDPGYVCVDDPNDSCNPNAGGRDCGGICQCGTPPDYGYLATDPARCAVIRFKCDSRHEPFFNSCGCGCKVIGS